METLIEKEAGPRPAGVGSAAYNLLRTVLRQRKAVPPSRPFNLGRHKRYRKILEVLGLKKPNTGRRNYPLPPLLPHQKRAPFEPGAQVRNRRPTPTPTTPTTLTTTTSTTPTPTPTPTPAPGPSPTTGSGTGGPAGVITGAAAGAATTNPVMKVLKALYWPSKRPEEGWKGPKRITRSWTRPLVGGAVTGGILSGGGSAILAGSLKDDMPLPDTSEDISNSGGGSSFVAPLVGASTAGLGSLLYGKLKDKPSLKRDLIATLIGGTAGIAYNLMKSSADADDIEINVQADMFDKEAGPVLSTIFVATTLASLLPMFMGKGDGDDDKYNEAIAQQKALQQSNYELNRSISRVGRGLGGAAIGGSLMGMASNLYGRAKDKKSLKRDLLATLSGTILGGAAGVYSAS